MNAMRLINPVRLAFSRDSQIEAQTAAAIEAEFTIEEPEPLLAKCIRLNGENMERLEGAAMRLEMEIASLSEQLRQTRVVLAARQAQADILAHGMAQAAE